MRGAGGGDGWIRGGGGDAAGVVTRRGWWRWVVVAPAAAVAAALSLAFASARARAAPVSLWNTSLATCSSVSTPDSPATLAAAPMMVVARAVGRILLRALESHFLPDLARLAIKQKSRGQECSRFNQGREGRR